MSVCLCVCLGGPVEHAESGHPLWLLHTRLALRFLLSHAPWASLLLPVPGFILASPWPSQPLPAPCSIRVRKKSWQVKSWSLGCWGWLTND
jgi:hypothetical protein